MCIQLGKKSHKTYWFLGGKYKQYKAYWKLKQDSKLNYEITANH